VGERSEKGGIFALKWEKDLKKDRKKAKKWGGGFLFSGTV
jgi:hypothetical protein